MYLLLTIRHNILYNLIIKKEVFMFKLKEFNIRISLYSKGREEAFKLFLLKTMSLSDARTIAEALKKYYDADYSTTEII